MSNLLFTKSSWLRGVVVHPQRYAIIGINSGRLLNKPNFAVIRLILSVSPVIPILGLRSIVIKFTDVVV